MAGSHTVVGLGSGPVKKKVHRTGSAFFVNHGGEAYIVRLKKRHQILNNPPVYHDTYEVVIRGTLLAWEVRIWDRFLNIS